ncbi:MAG: LLM class flavin-dependent oxidoreductase, partial [Acidimicrobiia bacterium]
MDVALQLRGSYAEVLGAARWAEAEGLVALAMPDHYLAGTDPTLPAYDHLVQFAGLARETNHIELVNLVSPVTFRHPAVYAKMAVTLAEMSDNRFVLGL